MAVPIGYATLVGTVINGLFLLVVQVTMFIQVFGSKRVVTKRKNFAGLAFINNDRAFFSVKALSVIL
jgi:hypothetical protein